MINFLKKFPISVVNYVIKNQAKQKKITKIVVRNDGFVFTVDDEIHEVLHNTDGSWSMNYEIFTEMELRTWIEKNNPKISIEDSLLDVIFIQDCQCRDIDVTNKQYSLDYFISMFEKTQFFVTSNIVHSEQGDMVTVDVPIKLSLSKDLLIKGVNALVFAYLSTGADINSKIHVPLAVLNGEIKMPVSVKNFDYT